MRHFFPTIVIVAVLLIGIIENSEGKSQKEEVQLTQAEQKMVFSQYERIRKICGMEGKDGEISIQKGVTCFEAMGELIEISDKEITIKVSPKTGEVVSVYIPAVTKELKNWRKNTPEITSPTKEANQIKQIALKYIKLITEKPLPSNFVLSKIRYNYNDKTRDKGSWYIIWTRTLNGYEYQNDGISVSIVDYSGKLESFFSQTASEECPTETRITREKAERIAIAKASSVAGRIYTLYYGKPKNPTIFSVKLMIVNPNGFFEGKLGDYYSTPKCRLAYVIRVNFEVEPPKENVWIYVYVDANTGGVLGGDCLL